MQLQGLLLMLLLLVAAPVMALSANHEMFFIIMSIVLVIASIRKIFNSIFSRSENSKEHDDEFMEDFEEMTELDMKKFGKGINVTKNLIIILFLVYCTFYINSFFFKGISAAAILLQVFFIIKALKSEDISSEVNAHKIQYFFSSFLNIIIIIVTVFSKLTGSNF